MKPKILLEYFKKIPILKIYECSVTNYLLKSNIKE